MTIQLRHESNSSRWLAQTTNPRHFMVPVLLSGRISRGRLSWYLLKSTSKWSSTEQNTSDHTITHISDSVVWSSHFYIMQISDILSIHNLYKSFKCLLSTRTSTTHRKLCFQSFFLQQPLENGCLAVVVPWKQEPR